MYLRTLRSTAVLLVLLGACRAWAADYQAIPVDNGGSVAVFVRFSGAAPAGETLTVTKDMEVCGKAVPKEDLVVDAQGGLQNAVVFLENIARGKKGSPTPLTVANQGCRFLPHVQSGRIGETLTVTNGDAVSHNTHIYVRSQGGNRTVFHKILPDKGSSHSDSRALRAEGVYEVKCDAHAFMTGWMALFSHPYHAVTSANGKAMLSDIPPGEYSIAVWHESLGEKRQRVVIEPGGSASIEFSFSK